MLRKVPAWSEVHPDKQKGGGSKTKTRMESAGWTGEKLCRLMENVTLSHKREFPDGTATFGLIGDNTIVCVFSTGNEKIDSRVAGLLIKADSTK